MGLFAVDFGETLDYLFTFMQQCLDDAKQREYLCKVTVSDKVKKNVHK